jgi:hypothetical protein
MKPQKGKIRDQSGKTASRVRAGRGDKLLSLTVLLVIATVQALMLDNPESPDVSLYRIGRFRKEALLVEEKLDAWRVDLGAGLCGENHHKVLFEVRAEQDRLMDTAMRSGRKKDENMESLLWFENVVMGSLDRKKGIPGCVQTVR